MISHSYESTQRQQCAIYIKRAFGIVTAFPLLASRSQVIVYKQCCVLLRHIWEWFICSVSEETAASMPGKQSCLRAREFDERERTVPSLMVVDCVVPWGGLQGYFLLGASARRITFWNQAGRQEDWRSSGGGREQYEYEYENFTVGATDFEIIPMAPGDETYKSKVSTQKGLSTVDEVPWRSETAIPLDTLIILDHIVAQDVRRLESIDIPRIPNLDLELRRDSAPGGSSSLQGCCNHLPTVPTVSYGHYGGYCLIH